MITHDGVQEIRDRVGKSIRQIRLEKGLTQESVSNRSGLVSRHLQKIEAGEVNVTLRSLGKIALALDVDISEFFKNEEA